MFESWRGRYADSPRAISERLAQRYPELRQIWVANDGVELPEHAEAVRRHGPEYFARLVSTDFLVTNDIVSRHFVKGPRTTYVQAWHGTPLKTIGYDEEDPAYGGAHHRRAARDIRKWDHLISPSAECTRLFRSAFRYDGDVLESGYPRNDVLRSPEADAIRARVRSQLGIAEGTTAVLYAPTWRDDVRSSEGGFDDPGGLDIAQFLSSTVDTALLVRMHAVVSTRLGDDHAGRAIDVSAHPDIAELYLASDVLVSDYSSAVYDFAVTGRPIVLFAYDLEHYCSVRSLYYDYETWAPGPIVTSTEELAATVAAVSADPAAAVTDRYRDFVERFCPHEDGGASDRVIDAVFAPRLD
jgi:CDP-glycerol glycerophosphotransferase